MPPKKKQKRNISGLRNQPPRQLPPVVDETNIDSADCSGTSGLSAIEEAGSETQPPNVSPDSKTPEATSSTSSSCQVGDGNEEESDNFHASKTENPKEVDTADTPPHSEGNKKRKNTYREENGFTYLVMRKRTNNRSVRIPSPDDDEFKPGRKPKTTVAVTTARPSTYKKGPDVASKSDRTQDRYRDLLRNQTSLDGFGFKTA